jgi:hypothetical protein
VVCLASLREDLSDLLYSILVAFTPTCAS